MLFDRIMFFSYLKFLLYLYTPEDVPLVESSYLVFTRMPGESYRRRLRSFSTCVTYFER